jgi:putative membrane protein
MSTLARVLCGFVAVQHLLFLVVEMFLWQSPTVRERFGMTVEFAAQSAALAMNQGLYNGFLAAGLAWAVVTRAPSLALPLGRFFLGCVVIAGVFGGLTAKASILFVQGAPAALAFASTFLGARRDGSSATG